MNRLLFATLIKCQHATRDSTMSEKPTGPNFTLFHQRYTKARDHTFLFRAPKACDSEKSSPTLFDMNSRFSYTFSTNPEYSFSSLISGLQTGSDSGTSFTLKHFARLWMERIRPWYSSLITVFHPRTEVNGIDFFKDFFSSLNSQISQSTAHGCTSFSSGIHNRLTLALLSTHNFHRFFSLKTSPL